MNEYYQDREEDGEYHLIHQPDKFHQYFKMTPETFYYILDQIQPIIVKESAFRKCISPEGRLMITLR